jgi:hypothetical protein
MKKYELKVKFGRKLMYHQVFEFIENEQQAYLHKIVERFTGNEIGGELEDVLCRHFGRRWYFKEFRSFPNPLSIYKREIKELAEKYPDMLVAAVLQYECYNAFGFTASNFPPVVCNKAEVLVDATETFSYECKIIN